MFDHHENEIRRLIVIFVGVQDRGQQFEDVRQETDLPDLFDRGVLKQFRD